MYLLVVVAIWYLVAQIDYACCLGVYQRLEFCEAGRYKLFELSAGS